MSDRIRSASSACVALVLILVLTSGILAAQQGPGSSALRDSVMRLANQPAIQNRSTYVKWEEILVMPAQRFGERQVYGDTVLLDRRVRMDLQCDCVLFFRRSWNRRSVRKNVTPITRLV